MPPRGPGAIAAPGLAPGGARGGLYYGWVLVLVLGLTETVSWGVLYYAFTVFVRPMEAELGWSRAAVSGAFSLAVLTSGVAAVPVGRWLDRHGPRALMTAGAAGFARDRLLGRRTPPRPNGLGVEDPTLRYYRDLNDQQNHDWGGFGGRPL